MGGNVHSIIDPCFLHKQCKLPQNNEYVYSPLMEQISAVQLETGIGLHDTFAFTVLLLWTEGLQIYLRFYVR